MKQVSSSSGEERHILFPILKPSIEGGAEIEPSIEGEAEIELNIPWVSTEDCETQRSFWTKDRVDIICLNNSS